jgi:hypothetical protein
MHRSRSHDAVIRVYDEAGNVIETQEHAGNLESRSGPAQDRAVGVLNGVQAHPRRALAAIKSLG